MIAKHTSGMTRDAVGRSRRIKASLGRLQDGLSPRLDERATASPLARPSRSADRHIGGRPPRYADLFGDPGVAIELAKAIARGDPANVSRLELGAHTGTHVDAPRHFIPDGESASELALDPFIGLCVVAETNSSEQLGRTAIDSLDLPSGDRANPAEDV